MKRAVLMLGHYEAEHSGGVVQESAECAGGIQRGRIEGRKGRDWGDLL